ncbi:MAG: restriction endonuclease [Sedimenticola sp.]
MIEREQLVQEMTSRYSDAKPKTILNWVSQVWPFANAMQKGDWIVLPSKSQPVVNIGEITGEYEFVLSGPDPFFHRRAVKWIAEDVPRSHFGQDLLYSFGAFMTICRIKRNNAEERLKAMAANGWAAEQTAAVIGTKHDTTDDEAAETDNVDLEELAQDHISRFIEARFKGHNLTRLVEAILNAKGYATYMSPEGADGGADILAGNGPMGFGEQRICVEVKSESTPVGREVADKLLGAVDKFRASQGLLVSWGGFKSNVQKELVGSFFKLRLWSRKELLEELFAHYDELEDNLKAELPLKRVWTIALQEET